MRRFGSVRFAVVCSAAGRKVFDRIGVDEWLQQTDFVFDFFVAVGVGEGGVVGVGVGIGMGLGVVGVGVRVAGESRRWWYSSGAVG